ncbi:histidine kinase dimerization/phosphoacceptor domain-containing protein [Streptomyces sp. NPDC046374]|uniref:histidine kinase dimerization/phosphoacceptor domain-containing protein n=1 Tax=Streptomyces sp. NPDC046374 TaxID=3154917 RepID=UPI0033E59B99
MAHHLTVIAVRAEVARAVASSNPQEAEQTLALVGTAGRTALTEMRRMLGVLRSPTDEAELGSAPGLADLPALADGAGPRVQLSVDPHPLPPRGWNWRSTGSFRKPSPTSSSTRDRRTAG